MKINPTGHPYLSAEKATAKENLFYGLGMTSIMASFLSFNHAFEHLGINLAAFKTNNLMAMFLNSEQQISTRLDYAIHQPNPLLYFSLSAASVLLAREAFKIGMAAEQKPTGF